ncbi:hypothetical protein NFI96_033464 [Prochilodus magdalenae]|nr:hypothetical protein NFI96_033464 [Prochilodus magdalenae]
MKMKRHDLSLLQRKQSRQWGSYLVQPFPQKTRRVPQWCTLDYKGNFNILTQFLQILRAFTLRDFKLNLEPINLLEEVFSGEEWARFLPDKESLSEADINSQPQPEISKQLDEVLYQNLDTKQDISKNKDQSQPDIGQISDIPSDKVIPLRQRQGQSDSIIFAVPKALISNGAVKQRKSEVPQHDLSDEEDVYDFVEVYMLPKEDPLHMSKAKDLPLDLSAVKSLGMLDNSALKSRIHLSKKRKHRPPKKRKKEKSKATPKSKFYTSWTSMDLPDHISASTNSSSVQSPFSNCTNPASSCDSEASPDPTPAEEKVSQSKLIAMSVSGN